MSDIHDGPADRFEYQNGRRNQKHYCRLCDTTFEPNLTGIGATSHMTCVLHMHEAHRHMMPIACPSRCEQRAQPEEIRMGVKLYGVGSVQPTRPIKTLEELLGSDEHEHM